MQSLLPKKPTSKANLQQWLEYLLAIHPSEIDMGLTRVTQVAAKMKLLDLAPSQIITVAGTNGKGTTCALLESILLCAGKSVGVYSSPHLLRYNERVRVNLQDCSDTQFIQAFNAIESAREEISLTFFEFATLAALYIFKQTQPDVILLEVGLGGRLDATNMIDSMASVITSIDLDHQEYLGDTRELVGKEKAGVFRKNCLAVIGEPNLPQTVIDYGHDIGAHLLRVGHEFTYQKNGDTWSLNASDEHTIARYFTELTVPTLPLANAATAVTLVQALWADISTEAIQQGLSRATLVGRLERLEHTNTVLMDVAHNPHAAHYLASQLAKYKGSRIIAICGMLKDKDISGVMEALKDIITDWNMVTLHTERGASAESLKNCCQPMLSAEGLSRIHTYEEIDSAWHQVNNTITPDDVVIVFGSFYTVAAFKSLFN